MLYLATHHRDKNGLHQAPLKQGTRRSRLLRMALFLGVLGMLFSLSSCVELDDNPRIVTVSVNPSTIEYNRYTGPMDVSILIEGFEGEIVEADVFIQLPPGSPRDAQKTSFSADLRAIELHGIDKTWFTNLEPGTYDLGASVTSDAGESIEQLDLATVTITD